MSSNEGTNVLDTYLYPLYQIDILTHMVYDTFHTICLNIVKNKIEPKNLMMDQTQGLPRSIKDLVHGKLKACKSFLFPWPIVFSVTVLVTVQNLKCNFIVVEMEGQMK